MMGEVNARALRDLWNENKLKIVTYRVMVWLKSNLAEKWQNENKTKPITTVTKNMIRMLFIMFQNSQTKMPFITLVVFPHFRKKRLMFDILSMYTCMGRQMMVADHHWSVSWYNTLCKHKNFVCVYENMHHLTDSSWKLMTWVVISSSQRP